MKPLIKCKLKRLWQLYFDLNERQKQINQEFEKNKKEILELLKQKNKDDF
ncbi:MAG: hypothetical protein ACI3ZR_07075 [bacterium]